ncbi:hypothetical protein M5D96_010806 [Drosophila gunungcola]|uniref:Uncharacterized protein n=1 Tax=Drosophila gunungcola TaxID=103775 RepID=A0A9Q0BM18_9MUSC|nr:hypothetical protein M5D96_010806 [Drosophila gunungcola]
MTAGASAMPSGQSTSTTSLQRLESGAEPCRTNAGLVSATGAEYCRFRLGLGGATGSGHTNGPFSTTSSAGRPTCSTLSC